MGELTDKAKGLGNEIAGNVKQAAGKASDNQRLEGEGIAQRWLVDEVGLSSEAARQLLEYCAAQVAGFGLMPTQRQLTMERFFDESGSTHLVIHSPYGMILRSIRENENRAISLGYTVSRYKLGAFVMSAALAGLAGGLKALVFQFATLTDVSWQMSGEVVLMTLLGGIGTLVGPVFGAALVTTLGNYFATSELPVTLVTGIIFMVCVLVFRRGMIGELYASRLGKKLERRAED